MDRREVLKTLGGAMVMASAPAVALAVNETADNLVWGKNLDGVDVCHTKELAHDLWELHGIRPEEILTKIHGTKFTIMRSIMRQSISESSMQFAIKTNNERDDTRALHVPNCTFSHDGRVVISASDASILVWHDQTRRYYFLETPSKYRIKGNV